MGAFEIAIDHDDGIAMKSFMAIARTIADLPDPGSARDDMIVESMHMRRSAQAAIPRSEYIEAESLDRVTDLASIFTIAPESSIVAAFRNAGPRLAWHYSYEPREGEPNLSDKIAFAELIGPDGPLFAPDCRIGFTLMAPQTLYPMHAHPAIELYRVIAGNAEWTVPQSSRIVPPGGSVLHPSGLPHAMQTFAETLLALYSWRGDIHTPPHYL